MIFSFLCTAFFLSAESRTIEIEGQMLKVEIADTEESRATGLMWRKKLDEGRGMLFVYEKPQKLAFWMKNTFIPLTIGYFDEHRVLIQTLDMNPGTLSHHVSKALSLYALEVPQGWFAKMKIKPGAKFSFLDDGNSVK